MPRFVWIKTMRGVSPQLWSDEVARIARNSGPTVLAGWEVEADWLTRDGALRELAKLYPCPVFEAELEADGRRLEGSA